MAFSLKNIFGGGGGSAPAFDPRPLRDILMKGAETQRNIAGSLPGQLQPFSEQLQTRTNELGQNYTAASKALSDRLQAGAVNPAATEAALRAKQEQTFRNVPAQQRAIREALASSNGLATGRGAVQVAAPITEAAQQVSDFGSTLNLQNEQARQDALKSGISIEQQGELAKLGLDTDTMKTLFETGRGDIVQQAADLLGIEGDLSQGLFNLENTSQQSRIAQAQADQANRQALINALLGVGGTIAGGAVSGYLSRPRTPAPVV